MTSQLLDRVPLFAGLGRSQKALIEERLQEVQFAAGDSLFSQGEPAQRLFLIESGWVRLVSANGAVLATLGAGSTLADMDMLMDRPHATGAQAVGAVTASTLSASDMERLIQRDTELGLALSHGIGVPISAMRNYVRSRLHSVPGWRKASRASLLALTDQLSLRDAAAGQQLYEEGDTARALLIIERGQVRLSNSGRSSQEVSLGAGAVLGDLELLTGKPHARSARVVEDAILWVLSASAFAELTRQYPELKDTLSQELRAPLSADEQREAVLRLRAMPTFSRWPDDALQELASTMLMQHVSAGTMIYNRGALGDAMYILDSGRVELRADGEVLTRLNSGNEFGEIALLTGRTRVADAFAPTDATLWVLYRSDFERVQSRYPAAQAAMNETVARRLAAGDEAFFDRHLRNISLLAGLSRPQLEAVRRRLQAVRFREGEPVYQQGDEADGLYMIEQGQVQIETPDAAITTLGEGDIFGEGALLLDEPRTTTAWAATDADLWLLRREDFEDLMLQYPSLALNLSRVMGKRLRENGGTLPAPPSTRQAATRQVAPAPRRTGRPQAPPKKASTVGPLTGIKTSIDNAVDWFLGRSTMGKIQVVIILLLVLWLCGVAAPALVINAVSASEAQVREMSMAAALPVYGGLEVVDTPTPEPPAAVALAQANVDIEATPTYTPWPTETPIPTNTPTITPTPTNTPTPTDTPTATPTFTPIPTNTPIPPTPVPQPVEAVAAAFAAAEPTTPPKPAVEWQLVSARRLSPCENRGKHHIFVKVLDVAGNPVNGVMVAQTSANQIGALLDSMPSGTKGDGQAEFTMWKGAQYAVYIANSDGSPASTEIAQPLHSGFTDEANCDDGGGGNTLFHNSFEVIFQRTS